MLRIKVTPLDCIYILIYFSKSTDIETPHVQVLHYKSYLSRGIKVFSEKCTYSINVLVLEKQ